MFFLKKLRKDMLIEPALLGPKLMVMVKRRIYGEVEGTCLGELGYVVGVSISNVRLA
jgi:DNA-directed RNA polymerase subunit E'/Rpb7